MYITAEEARIPFYMRQGTNMSIGNATWEQENDNLYHWVETDGVNTATRATVVKETGLGNYMPQSTRPWVIIIYVGNTPYEAVESYDSHTGAISRVMDIFSGAHALLYEF